MKRIIAVALAAVVLVAALAGCDKADDERAALDADESDDAYLAARYEHGAATEAYAIAEDDHRIARMLYLDSLRAAEHYAEQETTPDPARRASIEALIADRKAALEAAVSALDTAGARLKAAQDNYEAAMRRNR